MKLSQAYPLILTGVFMLVSCSNISEPDVIMDIPDNGWAYAKPLVYAYPAVDEGVGVPISVQIRHSKEYDYQNIYLLLKWKDGKDKVLQSRVEAYELATKSGRWNGKCSGSICVYEQPLDTIQPILSGIQSLEIEQFTRDTMLNHVLSIGIIQHNF